MLELLVNIVLEASQLMQTEDFSISQKEGVANIVTSSDIAVQDFLCQQLSRLIPGCGTMRTLFRISPFSMGFCCCLIDSARSWWCMLQP